MTPPSQTIEVSIKVVQSLGFGLQSPNGIICGVLTLMNALSTHPGTSHAKADLHGELTNQKGTEHLLSSQVHLGVNIPHQGTFFVVESKVQVHKPGLRHDSATRRFSWPPKLIHAPKQIGDFPSCCGVPVSSESGPTSSIPGSSRCVNGVTPPVATNSFGLNGCLLLMGMAERRGAATSSVGPSAFVVLLYLVGSSRLPALGGV